MIPPWFHLPDAPVSGHVSGQASDQLSRPRNDRPIIIIGAGLAGAWLAFELARRGLDVIVLERGSGAASGASANPVGVAKPFVTREPSRAADYHAFCWQQLKRRLQLPTLSSAGFQQTGVLQLTERPYPPCPATSAVHYSVLDREQARQVAGQAVQSATIHFDDAGLLNPAALCHALLDQPRIQLISELDITALEPAEHPKAPRWSIQSHHDRRFETDTLVLATGASIGQWRWTAPLPITPARGQLSRFRVKADRVPLQCVVTGRHYAIPLHHQVMTGATYQRDEIDACVRDADHRENARALDQLLPDLGFSEPAEGGHAGIRATTPDRLPLVGPVPDWELARQHYRDLARGRSPDGYPPLPLIDGLHVLGGLGSRGIVTAPGSAALLADYLSGDQSTGDAHTLQAWTPEIGTVRYLIRALKRARG